MKWRLIVLGIISLCIYSCEDKLNSVGMGMLPDEDEIHVFADTVYIDAVTVKLDSIYAKSIMGMLGEFYDPQYGTLKGGFMCQFYSPNKPFPNEVVDDKIDSVTLALYYAYWLGDSITPMEATVYPVVNSLDKHYYSNIDPKKYCNLNTPIGRKAYTARDLNISDSLYKEMDYKVLRIKLPAEIGTRFLEESKKPAPNAFSTLDDFTKFFKGIYITTTYGTGNLLQIAYTDLYVHYNSRQHTTDSKGNDSIYVARDSSIFNVTKEIIQLNSYSGANDEKLLIPSDERTYIKTPAGIFTKLIIPIPEIVQRVGDKRFNNAKLTLTAFQNETWEHPMGMPTNMLLINPDSVNTFFENQAVPPYYLSYSATLNNYAYSFGNISNVVQNAMTKAPDKNLELLLMPISYYYYYDTYNNAIPYAASNYLGPSGVSLKKGNQYLRLEMLMTDMDLNKLK